MGHSWGCDLAVRYAVEHPEAVAAVVGIAGKGPHRDRTWSEAYEAGKAAEPAVDIDWVPEVHAALGESFTDWIHRPDLWRRLADCQVPMHFIAAADDIRPSWPLTQLAALVPRFQVIRQRNEFLLAGVAAAGSRRARPTVALSPGRLQRR